MTKTSVVSIAGVTLVILGVGLTRLGQGQSERPKVASFQIMESSIDEIHAAYRSGQLTAHQLIQAYLDRIAAYDKQGPTINSIIKLNAHAMEEADKLDAQFKRSGLVGPLHGIPILVKDEIDAVGMPTTLGTLVFKDYRPTRDAFVVEQLKKAGAVILGKSTLSEFAGGDTYGFDVRRHSQPVRFGANGRWLLGRLGRGPRGKFFDCDDWGGDVRVRSTARRLERVVGLRPTPGLVSRSGMYDGYPRPQAQPAPMARSVRDVADIA